MTMIKEYLNILYNAIAILELLYNKVFSGSAHIHGDIKLQRSKMLIVSDNFKM